MSESEPAHAIRPTQQRWTHLALHVNDIDASVAWYTKYTHLEVLARNEDQFGKGAWLGDRTQVDTPFILVIAQFFEGKDPFAPAKHPVLAPFAHMGIEVTSKEEIDAIAEKGREAGCLTFGPQMMPKHIGYICFLEDPDGNTIEFSYDQGVYEEVQKVWGDAAVPA